MTYDYTGNYLLALITFFAVSIGNIFTSLDNVPFFDAPFSILDVFIAILLWHIISWFILRLLTGENFSSGEDFENEQAKYEQYGESYHTSASEDEIDFSEEIVHE